MANEKEMSTEATHSSAYASTLSNARGAAGMFRLSDVNIEQTGVVYEMRYRSGWVVWFKLGCSDWMLWFRRKY